MRPVQTGSDTRRSVTIWVRSTFEHFRILVEGDASEAVLFADVDAAVVRDARAKFPALADRRPEAYRR